MTEPRRGGKNGDRESGTAATEFALIAPLLIVLFFGIVQIGIAMYRSQVVEAAAREGARVASVGGTLAEVETVADASAPGFDPSEITAVFVQVSGADDDCDGAGDDTTIRVTATGARLNFEIPFIGSFTPNFTAEATFRCETETP